MYLDIKGRIKNNFRKIVKKIKINYENFRSYHNFNILKKKLYFEQKKKIFLYFYKYK